MKKILDGLDVKILSAKEAGVMEEPVEDGETFADNALIKAKYVFERTKDWTVADDSGLCVDALNGAPGLLSARWAGETATGEEKAEKVLRELGNLPAEKRGAYFECSAALLSPAGERMDFAGRVYGQITFARRETIKRPHLPYDAIFIPKGFAKTFGEMTDEEKEALSHRGQAFRKLKDFLSKKINIMV